MQVVRRLTYGGTETLFVPTNSQLSYSGKFFGGEYKFLTSARNPESIPKITASSLPEVSSALEYGDGWMRGSSMWGRLHVEMGQMGRWISYLKQDICTHLSITLYQSCFHASLCTH